MAQQRQQHLQGQPPGGYGGSGVLGGSFSEIGAGNFRSSSLGGVSGRQPDWTSSIPVRTAEVQEVDNSFQMVPRSPLALRQASRDCYPLVVSLPDIVHLLPNFPNPLPPLPSVQPQKQSGRTAIHLVALNIQVQS